ATPAPPAPPAGPGDLALDPDDPERAGFGSSASSASASIGTAQNGRLQDGVSLQDGQHLRLVGHVRKNAIHYGTWELVQLLARGASDVARDHPGSMLRIGNLSRQQGGDIGPSVSHNSGRDADVLFYAVDRLGQDGEPAPFCRFDANGVSDWPAEDAGRYEFDTARNWLLVRSWLGNVDVVVQWIFVAAPLRNLLLDHALRIGEPATLRARAARVLAQPRDSSPHADHFHVRIACPASDRPACLDGGVATGLARAAQVDALLQMYHQGSPEEQRYARELLRLPESTALDGLPPIEGAD
ncbi:MAG: penicillin-insensitive murein endopeptidase, partial [Deltaproteobacteria bacterium]|nr:penicillin-insensitive murein endopeptidase [Deltaproteobacteria bacterium]